MARIIVHLEGGLVDDAFLEGKGPVTGVVVMDFDTEEADQNELTTIKVRGKEVQAYIHTEPINRLLKSSVHARLLRSYDKE
jgi:hypothetical protein